MANYATLKAAISQVIKENGNKEITGAVMQTTLLAMVDSMASGYTFAGVATPSTSAGTSDENVFWIGGAGSYSNFGATTINVPTGCICIFTYNGSFASSILYVGGVVDISKLTNTSYASLSQALADVPSYLQVGWLEIIYQDSTSGKNVKYRLMATSWSTTITDWQGVDNVPTLGSPNLITSEGVKSFVDYYGIIKGYDELIASTDKLGLNNREKNGYADDENWLYTSNAAYKHLIIPIEAGQEVYIKAKTNAFTNYGFIKNYRGEEENGKIYWCDGTGKTNLAANAETTITAPNDAVALYILKSYNNGDNLPSSLTIDDADVIIPNPSILTRVTTIENEQSAQKGILQNKADVIQSANLLDINSTNILNGYYLQYNGFASAANYKCSQPIKVVKGKTYKFGTGSNLYGNSKFVAEVSSVDYSYIRTIEASVDGSYNTFTADKDMLVRFNLGNSSPVYNEMMFCESDNYPEQYTPYYRMLADFGNYIKNPLYGKKISFNGDSICYGVGYLGGYGKIIAERNNMAYQNIAVGGATIVKGTYSGETPRHWICDTIDDMDSDADYIILEGGVNDASLQVTIGNEPSPYYSETFDDTIFVGALESMFKKCYARFAGKKLGFVITHGMTNGWRYGIDTYTAMIRKCCEKWGIPYIDLQKECPPMFYLNSDIGLSIKADYTNSGDGWHPNEQGYLKYYCDKIEAWLKSL